MDDSSKQTPTSCCIERVSETTETQDGKTTSIKEAERKTYTGEAAIVIANGDVQAKIIESQAKAQGICTIAKGIACGAVLAGAGLAVALNSSSTPPPDDNIPGSGSGAA